MMTAIMSSIKDKEVIFRILTTYWLEIVEFDDQKLEMQYQKNLPNVI